VTPPLVHDVAPDAWRPRVLGVLDAGWTFAALWADERRSVHAAFLREDTALLLRADGPVASIVDLVPAAAWDEREAHDLYGVGFAGHEPLRPLVVHPDELSAWTVPVRGDDAFQVAVGPIHAGVIESGHFRFHVVGETVLHLDLRLFYKHRGLERAAEGLPPADAMPYVQRACAADAVANAVAFAHACESAHGLHSTAGLARARTLLLELERLYNHLNDLSAVCSGVGFAAGAMAFAALKERAQRLNHQLTGHRFLFGAVAVGASALTVDDGRRDELREELARIRADASRAWRELHFAGSVQERFTGVGVLSAGDARRLGAVGPSARAAGVAIDARHHSPRLAYAGFSAARPAEPTGDVTARVEMRAAELPFVFDCLDVLLADPIVPATAEPGATPAETGFGVVESPRGQTVCAVRLRDGIVARIHLRTGSYANWPAVAHVVPGNLLPDFPLINKSFELCYACADR
jgi:Ni,Fe-hydrogenase III large subunit